MDSSLLIAALQQLLKRFFRAEPAEALIEWKGEAQFGGGRDLKTWGSHGDLKIWAIFMV